MSRVNLAAITTILVTFFLFLSPIVAAPITASDSEMQPAHSAPSQPPIRITMFSDYPPFTVLDALGRPSGILVDIWQAWGRQVGRRIEFQTVSWPSTLKSIKQGKADIHSGLFASEDRSEWLSYSQPLYELKSYLYRRKGSLPTALGQIAGERIAVVGNTFQETWLKKNYPDITLSTHNGVKEMLIALMEEEVDALVGEHPTTEHLALQLGFASRIQTSGPPLLSNTLHGAVLKENTALQKKMRDGFDALDQQTLYTIEKLWVDDPERRFFHPQTASVELSPEEKRWISDHPIIRLGVDPNWAPYEYVGENGTYLGMASDYVRLLNERLGLSMQIVPDLTWSEVIQAGKQRRLDIFPAVTRNRDRERFMTFSQPYISLSWMIVTRAEDAAAVSGVDSLSGWKTAVVRDYTSHKRMEYDAPDVPLLIQQSTLDALKAVSSGKARAAVVSLGVSTVLIHGHNLSSLRVASPAFDAKDHLSFAVRSDWPTLVTLINRGLATISKEEHQRIYHKWIAVPIEHGIDERTVIFWGIIGTLLTSLIVGLFLFWNRRLQREVSVRRKIEGRLRRARFEAEAANQAKGDFLATMSHEIRTPMNVVVGMSDVLLDTPLNQDQKLYIQKLQHAGTTLLELINNILDLSKIEAGHLDLSPSTINPTEIAHQVISVMTVQAEEKGLELHIRIDEGVPIQVEGDGTRLRQVLLNLIGNAVKFTDKGRITLTLNQDKTEREKLHFQVQDTGMGIGPENLESIFDAFTQADAGITRRFGGTGLGLSISRQLASRMGGLLWVESEPGVGSTFHLTVTMPLVEQSDTTNDQTNTPSERERTAGFTTDDTSCLNILLAEDSEDNQLLIKTYLKRTPHQLTIFSDGREAVSHFKTHADRIDLILMDIQMPIMDGYSAVRAIRFWEREQIRTPIPIYALTAHALSGDREKSLEAGCNDHLTKPIKKSVLLNLLAQHTAQRDR
ncbi:MAG: transporter substrate-binding domain-containing protein [Magnetococcales bacterium]|nr:transporter substrate-binding domain-containing protein [Magnetococcales bacterium]